MTYFHPSESEVVGSSDWSCEDTCNRREIQHSHKTVFSPLSLLKSSSVNSVENLFVIACLVRLYECVSLTLVSLRFWNCHQKLLVWFCCLPKSLYGRLKMKDIVNYPVNRVSSVKTQNKPKSSENYQSLDKEPIRIKMSFK